VAPLRKTSPDIEPAGDAEGDLLIIAWGSTHGAITAAVKAQRAEGRRVGHVHLRHLNPLPSNLGEVIKRYKKVLVPELNMGQLLWVLRAKYLVDAVGLNKSRADLSNKLSLSKKLRKCWTRNTPML